MVLLFYTLPAFWLSITHPISTFCRELYDMKITKSKAASTEVYTLSPLKPNRSVWDISHAQLREEYIL